MELSQEYLALKAKASPGVRKAAQKFEDALAKHTTVATSVTVTSLPRKVKHVVIEATFPELRGGKMYQSGHGEASGTKPAIARAFRDLLKKIPGKRVSVIKATISITTKNVEG